MIDNLILKFIKFRIKRQLKNVSVEKPIQLLDDFLKNYGSNDQKIISFTDKIIGKTNIDEYKNYISTPEYKSFKNEIDTKSKVFYNKPYQLGAIDHEIDVIVSLLSLLKSPKVLEIGVANGYSSAFIYHMLAKNGGNITSIDLPRFYNKGKHPHQILLAWLAKRGKIKTTGTLGDIVPGGVIPADKYAGWLVPMRYRLSVPNITITGNAFRIMDEINRKDYDFVILDAMKDYKSRIIMLNKILDMMNKDSIGVMDGYWVNSAFQDFCSINNLASWKLGRIGIFKKLK